VAPPALSGPYLSQHLVINKFPEAVKNILGKDPEDVKWGTRVHDRKAMDFIQAEEVIAKVHKAMEELTIAKHN
jgi:heptosyltransferase I